MNLLNSRIERIKQTLRAKDLNQAATLLINTLASDEVFSYWSDCCQGSERVPKLLKYIHQITFDEALATAAVDLVRGDLTIGVQFFLDHITGPEDLLFILIHERNHLILRRLYPDILPGADYPREIFNFAEDAYVNAIGRRHVASTLPERFYRQPGELLLTAKHSQIDWTLFSMGENGTRNYFKQAHASLYQWNLALLQALGEVVGAPSGFSGYRRWMDLVCQWYREKQNEEARRVEMAASSASEGEGEARPPGEEASAPGPETGGRDAPESEADRDAEDQPSPDEDMQDSEEELAQDRGSDGPEPDKEEQSHGEAMPESGSNEPGKAGNSEGGEGVAKNGGFQALAAAIKAYAPLVEGSLVDTMRPEAPEEGSIQLILVPDLRRGDLIYDLILETSDLSAFRHRVRLFEPEALAVIDEAIQGVLADRATEKTLEGYSIPVPPAITKKDLFNLADGIIPAVWERRWGVERPHIDLYIDVSRQPGVTPGHLDTAVAQELLQTLQTHPGVQLFGGGAGVSETMETVALMGQAGCLQISGEPHPDGGVT